MGYQFERRKKGTAGVSRWFLALVWERVEINFIFQGCMESFVFKILNLVVISDYPKFTY
jgi:hypothetical protein